MAGFLRIRQCCCCGGSLKGGAITIGLFYVILALLGAISGGGNLLWNTGSLYGVCEENLFLPLLRETSVVSGIINLCLLYGAVASKSAFIAPWLAWNIAYPIVQLAHIVWSIIFLATCDQLTVFHEVETTIIVILVCNALSLASVLYFAVVIYSLYKDIQEEEKTNRAYGTRILMPSKNWDEELAPYTSYDPSAATPMNWGSLPAPPSYKGPAPQPPVQRPKSAGIPRPQSSQNIT